MLEQPRRIGHAGATGCAGALPEHFIRKDFFYPRAISQEDRPPVNHIKRRRS
jgi:hypothetical protein